jgi:hypothetical protein
MRWSTAVAGGMQIGKGCSSDYGAFDEASSNVAFALDCLQAGQLPSMDIQGRIMIKTTSNS